MVLFEFDKIIKHKYKNKYKTKNDKLANLSLDEFKNKMMEKFYSLTNLYFTGISVEYVKTLLENKNKIIFITMGQNFLSSEIISIIIYHKTISNNKIKYYILCFGIHNKLRKYGYGKNSLDEFVNWIKTKKISGKKEKILLLKSVESSLEFYKSYGFVEEILISNKLFFKYESIEELKNNKEKILKYIII